MKLFFGFVKSLINIVILTIIIVLVYTWASANDEQKQAILVKLDEATPFDLFETSQSIRNQVQKTIHASGNEGLKEALAFLNEEFSAGNDGHFLMLDPNCGIHNPAEQEALNIPQQKIYQWKDEHGRTHFGDASQSSNATDISKQYQSRTQYISTDIHPINTELPLDFDSLIKVSILKMFLVLSDSLAIDQLHPLALQLKVYGNEREFKSYQKQKAPNLSQVIGFYSPKDNEASILLQRNKNATMALIRHESSHVIMANLYGLSPIWLNEGFAEYFQGLKVAGLETTVYPNKRALHALRTLNQDGSLSLKKHLKLSVAAWQGKDVNRHYAEAWSIVYFLMSDHEGKKVLKAYFKELRENRCIIPDSSSFFDQYYPGGLDALDTKWKVWLNNAETLPHRY